MSHESPRRIKVTKIVLSPDGGSAVLPLHKRPSSTTHASLHMVQLVGMIRFVGNSVLIVCERI